MSDSLSLGVQLALANRASRARLALMSVGFGIAVCVLLAIVGLLPAQAARRGRELARYGTPAEGRAVPADATLIWPLGTTFKGRYIQSIAVVGKGQAPVPPGLSRLPDPGEVFASPALAEILRQPGSSLLRPRVPGHLGETIAPGGLLYPGELIAYVGAPKSVRSRHRDAQVVTSFGQGTEASAPLDVTGVVVIGLISVAALVPVAVFVMAVTRLSAASREARLAAIRLVGATQTQIRQVAATEVLLSATAGCLLGSLLFFLVRPAVATVPVVDYRFFPDDLAPSLGAALLVFVVVTGLATFLSIAAMRHVAVSPLGIVRRAPKPRRGSRWPAVLGLGLISMTLGALAKDWLAARSPLALGILTACAIGSVLIGVAGTGPWAGWRLASWVAAREPSPSVLLGARKLENEPSSAGRVIAGVTMLVALVAVAQAAALTGGSSGGTPPGVASLEPGTVVARAFRHAEVLDNLPEVVGVYSVTVTRQDPDGTVCAKPCVALVRTDGHPTTIERVRNQLAWVGSAETLQELRSSPASQDSDRLVGMMQLGMAFALLVTGAGLLVSTTDGVIERRRSIAVLSATGVPTTTVGLSVVVQVGLPLVSGMVLGATSGLVTAALLLFIVDEPIHLPIAYTLETAVLLIITVLLVTAAASPWIRIARRPELLRFE